MNCIISKVVFNEYGRRDIQTNVEQYCEDFALVPDNLIEGIVATEGFCDLELSEDGKTVVSFTAREIPKFPKPKASRNITAGEYITVNGILYKATTNIPNGGYIITGQNAVETTIEEQLYELTKGE